MRKPKKEVSECVNSPPKVNFFFLSKTLTFQKWLRRQNRKGSTKPDWVTDSRIKRSFKKNFHQLILQLYQGGRCDTSTFLVQATRHASTGLPALGVHQHWVCPALDLFPTVWIFYFVFLQDRYSHTLKTEAQSFLPSMCRRSHEYLGITLHT